MRQRTLGLCMLGAAAVSSLVTWVASVQIRSPAEVAARTAPPEPSPILVPVEERELATKIVSRGTGRYGSPRDVAVTRSRLKDGRQIVTSVPATGAVLGDGSVAFTISGRPTFIFDGRLPTYRDLGPGMAGSDVRQLEQGLKRIGLSPGRVDGRYDAATGQAVAALYRRRGFRPIIATQAQLDAVRPREARYIPGAASTGGVQMPADEVVFVPGSPVRVTKVGARLGSAPSGALITVTNSVVSVSGALPVDQAELVKPGARVLLDEPALGIKAVGKVAHVADRPGTNGVDNFHVFFDVVVANPPPALVGTSVRMTVPVKSTGKAEMVVPISAVSLGPDGGSRVQRSTNGKTEFIPVEPGLAADGYVAIKAPLGGLAPGDQVVVGFDPNSTGEAAP